MKKYKIKKEQIASTIEDVEIEVVTSHQITQKSIKTSSLKGINTQIASLEKQIAQCEKEKAELEAEKKAVEKEAKKYDLTLPAEVEEITET